MYEDILTGAKVAAKHIRPDGGYVQLERWIMKSSQSSRIIKYLDEYEYGEKSSSILVIIMELADSSLEQRLTKPIESPSVFRSIAWQMVEAVNYLHSNLHCFHRDLKMANFLIKGRRITLADFGCAAVIGQPSSEIVSFLQF